MVRHRRRRRCLKAAFAHPGVKDVHGIEKSVRIVITSGLVNQARFSKGLRESLEPRLRVVRGLLLSATVASSLAATENSSS